jgi:hypothetical protein
MIVDEYIGRRDGLGKSSVFAKKSVRLPTLLTITKKPDKQEKVRPVVERK